MVTIEQTSDVDKLFAAYEVLHNRFLDETDTGKRALLGVTRESFFDGLNFLAAYHEDETARLVVNRIFKRDD